MTNNLNVSVSPHIHSPRTTRSIMLDVIIALLPATAAGVIIFGLRALLVIAICVCTCVLSEYVFNLLCKKPITITDLSAIITGLLLGLNLPANIPIWQAVVGSVFAIVVVKCIFGGIGQNFANPAMTARVFMLISFASMANPAFPPDVDATATPLAQLAAGKLSHTAWDLIFGLRGGAIGETCIVALVIGGVYLLSRRVIRIHTPLAFILTVFLFTWAVKGDFETASYYTLTSGLFIGAIFMATDYSTTPTSGWGKIIFGVGCGILTVAIRLWGVYPEGVSFAILFMNILTPYIEKLTLRKPFGTGVHAK